MQRTHIRHEADLLAHCGVTARAGLAAALQTYTACKPWITFGPASITLGLYTPGCSGPSSPDTDPVRLAYPFTTLQFANTIADLENVAWAARARVTA